MNKCQHCGCEFSKEDSRSVIFCSQICEKAHDEYDDYDDYDDE